MNINLILTLLLVASASSGMTQSDRVDQPVQLDLTVDDEDGLVGHDQEVACTVTILNNAESRVEGTLTWIVHTVAFDPPGIAPVQLRLNPKETGEFTMKLKLPAPGFADIECVFKRAASDDRITQRRRIGVRPEEIVMPLTRQPDFGDFWKDSLAALAAVPPDFKIRDAAESSTNAIQVYEVTLHSFGSVRIRGWLEVPRGDGPYPTVILLPGYGQNMRPTARWDDMIVFSFNPRGHGNSTDDVPGQPVDYWIRGLDDKATYFYRGAFLDCVRAVDFLASRADVDQDRIAVWGESQGGGLAFATASLDPRIDLCVADIPFLCDWVDYFKLTHWPEMDDWIAADPARTWQSTLETLSYFDTMNLAQEVKCPTWMGVGLQDQICPPTTSFAAFNRINAPKSFRIDPQRGHGLDESHAERVRQGIRKTFGLAK